MTYEISQLVDLQVIDFIELTELAHHTGRCPQLAHQQGGLSGNRFKRCFSSLADMQPTDVDRLWTRGDAPVSIAHRCAEISGSS